MNIKPRFPQSRVAILGWLAAGVVFFTVLASAEGARDSDDVKLSSLFRRPVAMVLVDEGRLLFVANQRSGTVSVIDTAESRVVGEIKVGQALSDLVGTSDSKRLLALDEKTGELVVLARKKQTFQVSDRIKVGASPVSVSVSKDGSTAFVASLWGRELSIIALTSRPVIRKTITLPFAPRKQALIAEESKLLVADSFAGKLAVIDLTRGEIESVRSTPFHNIRGLALSRSSDKVLIACQTLSQHAQTTMDDIHWGNLMGNNLRLLSIRAVLDTNSDLSRGSEVYTLGDVNEGGGDPSGLVEGPRGEVIISLGGVSKIAVATMTNFVISRFAVGQRPTSLVLAADDRTLFVANTLSDTISVFDLSSRKVLAEIALGPQPEETLADRGEALFYDARLSHNGWMSCHSCHTDGHSNGSLNDNFGDGSFGAPKRILSLLGVRDTGPWAWNGTMSKLDDQIRNSIRTTMRGEALDEQVAALTEFLKTLDSAPPLRGTDGESVSRGEIVFREQGCAKCHAPPEYTTPRIYDVGLQDQMGNHEFNPPSLRGVSQRDSFFHDNRAHDLTAVFAQYHHDVKTSLLKQELSDLIAFLRNI